MRNVYRLATRESCRFLKSRSRYVSGERETGQTHTSVRCEIRAGSLTRPSFLASSRVIPWMRTRKSSARNADSLFEIKVEHPPHRVPGDKLIDQPPADVSGLALSRRDLTIRFVPESIKCSGDAVPTPNAGNSRARSHIDDCAQ